MRVKVKVVGVTPYLQHRMCDIKLQEWEKSRGKIIERDGLNDEAERTAAFHAYIDKEGNYYLPSEHFKQCLIKGGGFVKGKVGNATKSMKNIVAGMWRIEEERLPLPKFDQVDTRSAVNKVVKARIITHRPRWNRWGAEFTILIDDDDKNSVTIETVSNIVSYGGRYLGVGSYRPEHTGEFGRFKIENIEIIK